MMTYFIKIWIILPSEALPEMIFDTLIREPLTFIVFIIFSLSLLSLLIYYWALFSRFAFFSSPEKKGDRSSPVSVVICAKNEYHNLIRFLPHILEQDHPEFEVIVVNDQSDDETEELLEELKSKYNHLTAINLKQSLNFFRGKKFPLSIGIRSAKHENVVLTDADCRPRTNRWITMMAENFTRDTEVVLGYGAYARKPGLLNLLIRFDTMHIALQYFSFALAGFPYMGVGRNLAYRKSLFFKQKGFTSHYRIPSGDDDLFINKAANRANTAIEIRKQAHTVSEPKTSFSQWFRQKKRHLSTGKYYKPLHKFLLSVYSGSLFVFYATFIVLLALGNNIPLVLALFGIKLLSFLILFKKTCSQLEEKKLFLFSPLIEVIFVLLNPLLLFVNLIVKQNKWK